MPLIPIIAIAIYTAAGYAGITGVTAMAIANFIASSLVYGAISAALSLATGLLASKPKGSTALNSNGLQVNLRLATDKKRIHYGDFVSGGVVVLADTTSSDARKINDLLHIVIDWGEGIQAIAKDLEQPHFKEAPGSSGQSGLITNATYTGATSNHYLVRMQSSTTFKWSDDNGATWEATGVAITGAWQSLNNGVQIKFTYTSGYHANDDFDFWGGDGLWVDNRLFYYWMDLVNKQWIWHHFHSGTSTQAVDADVSVNDRGLPYYFPKWTNPKRHACYSYIRLKGSTNQDAEIWPSIPEFRLRRKKVDLYDPRTGLIGYSNNRALVYLDYKLSKRYGEGKDPSYVDLPSVIDAANWYDAASAFTFNGVIIDPQEHGDVLDQILFAGRAFRVDSGGKEKIKVWDDDSSVTSFTEFKKQIHIDPESFSISGPGILEAPHRVIAAFCNPLKNWTYDDQKSQASNIRTIAAAGKVIETKLELLGITVALDARRIAHWHRLSEAANRFNVLCHPKIFNLESGDMFTATHDFPGWTSEKVRVVSMGMAQEGQVPTIIREEHSEYYDLSGDDIDVGPDDPNPPNPPPNPPSLLPSQATGVSAADTSIDNETGLVDITVSWTDPDSDEGVIDQIIQLQEQVTP